LSSANKAPRASVAKQQSAVLAFLARHFMMVLLFFEFVNPQAFVPGRGLSLAGSRGKK
jgi:hypothetical protein